MEAASANLTPVTLELGGKVRFFPCIAFCFEVIPRSYRISQDPFIVFDDADFDKVLDIAVRSVFINNGQNCISAERLCTFHLTTSRFSPLQAQMCMCLIGRFDRACADIQEGIYDKFVKEMARRTNGLRLGKDCGCMTMPAQVSSSASSSI
jgi:acyl-CoA reductase-like NAD-dependent aldehyde dehydrogenase